MTSVLPVFRIGQRIFVHPVRPFAVGHRTVDALRVGQRRIALVGIRVVELGREIGITRISATDAQPQILVQIVVQLCIGEEGLLARHLVFVLARDDRVHHRGVVSVEFVVEQLLVERRGGGDDRPEGPRTVHQIRCIGIARRKSRRRGLAIGLVARIAGIDLEFGPTVELLGERDTSLILFIARTDDDTLLIGHRKRYGVLRLFRTAGHREVVHVERSVLEKFVLPVDPLPHVFVIFERAVQIVQIGIHARGLPFDLIADKIVGIHHLHLLGHVLEAVGSRVGDGGFALEAAVGLDDDDTVGTACSVDGRGGGILQHGQRSDVRHVDRRRGEILHRESVDDIQRRIALCQ